MTEGIEPLKARASIRIDGIDMPAPLDLAELVDELNGWMKDIHATLERIAKALEDLTDVTRFNGGNV